MSGHGGKKKENPEPEPDPVPPPKPAPAPPPKPAPKEYPKGEYNHSRGTLLFAENRLWPNRVWADPWSLPRYRNGAIMLAAIVFGGLGLSAAVGEISRFAAPIQDLITRAAAAFLLKAGLDAGLTAGLSGAVWALLKIVLVVHVIAGAPIFLVWWERKISAHMQSRFGPMYTGGFHGWLQTVVDGIKLFLKENITPTQADSWVHTLAPVLVVAPVVMAFAPVTFGSELAAADIDVGLVYIFAMTGVSVVGIMMAGWASGNKYSLLGGLRSAAQLVSYELPRGFSVVPVIMLAGSLNLSDIAFEQSGYWFGFIPRWYIFYPVVGQLAFLIFMIASVAETNRIPFDIPEAESELVAGFHTEFSGMKFSLFFLAEYAYVLLASLLMAAFFFGGGAAPLPFLAVVPSWAWFLAKVLVLVFCFLWFRWTFPRFRVDRLMDFNWKFLLPWSFANIAFTGFYLLF